MVNAIKEGIEIKVYNPFLALLYLATCLLYRLVRVAIRPESVAMGVESEVPRSGLAPVLGLLDEAVYDRRYPQLALATIRLGHFNPLKGLWSVATTQKLAFDLGPVVCQVLGQFFYRHAIDSGCTFVTFDLFQHSCQIIPIQYLRQQ